MNQPWPSSLSYLAWSPAAAESVRSWADLLQADTGTFFDITCETDTAVRFRAVGSGAAALTAGFANETSRMVEGDRTYLSRGVVPFPVRIVWPYSRSYTGFYTRTDSPIRTPSDIKPGARIADMSRFVSMRFVYALLAWAQVAREDIRWIPCSNMREVVSSVMNGEADLAFGLPANPLVQAAERTPPGIKWIGLDAQSDPEGAARYKSVYPLVDFGVMPEGLAASASYVWGTEGFNFVVTGAGTSPGLVYHLARWLDENHGRYRDRHPENRFRGIDTLLKALNHTYIPCHDGLIAYLSDKQLWSPAHARRHQANVDLIDRHCQVWEMAVETSRLADKPFDTTDESWLDLWREHKQAFGLPPIRVFSGLDDDRPALEHPDGNG